MHHHDSFLFSYGKKFCRAGAFFVVAFMLGSTAPAMADQQGKILTTGVAVFNMAWAGTAADFKRHLEICTAPSVKWCDTRPRIERGATAPTEVERMRAQTCAEATLAAAGGREASMLTPPCSAYRSSQPPQPGRPRPDPNLTRTPATYQQKLDNLRATVEALIEREAVRVIAFQEVRSSDVIRVVLGKYASKFDVCDAKHNAFQTLAFAWDKSLTSKPGVCETESRLAVLDPPADPTAFRRVRPGLSLTLTINDAPVTFMNVHLKAGCASVNNSNERFPGRMIDEPFEACEVLNRQVPLLEQWLESVSRTSPRFVLMGDFNRRIDDELVMAPDQSQVRRDGSDPAKENRIDDKGRVTTKFLWQEISDGSPVMHQIALSTKDGGCEGFQGLDHIVISDALKKINAGVIGSKKIGVVTLANQAIETSDHCPRVAQLKF